MTNFRRRLAFIISSVAITIMVLPACSALPRNTQALNPAPVPSSERLPYRGWGYLVGRLAEKGVNPARLKQVFEDPRMPPFSLITFKLKPVESHDIYEKFRSATKLREGKEFLRTHAATFERVVREYGVAPEVITAILLVETHFGANTGNELVLNRLARVSSVSEPSTLNENFERISEEQPDVTMGMVKDRATYLEETFMPQLIDLFVMAEREKLDIFSIKGSPAGAFGIPQFLPSSYLSFGVDGNGDGSISLYNITDAIFSTARFLKHYGWNSRSAEADKRKVVWNYNHSQAYVDTIFWLASGMARRRI